MPCPKTPFPRSALPADFGEKVARARTAKGWSKIQLATKIGVSRKTIGRLEAGATTGSLRLVGALMRDDVLGQALPAFKGWELDEPDRWPRGFLARAARIASGQTLAAVSAKAGGSTGSLSAFERGLLTPVAFTGDKFADDNGGVSELYAKSLGYTDAADMRAYLDADDRTRWLTRIAAAFGRKRPPAALLPTLRVREIDDTEVIPDFLLG